MTKTTISQIPNNSRKR